MFQLFLHSLQHLLLLAFFLLTSFSSLGRKIKDTECYNNRRTCTGLFHLPLASAPTAANLSPTKPLNSNEVFQSSVTFLDHLRLSTRKTSKNKHD